MVQGHAEQDGCHKADIDGQPAEPRDDMSMYLSCIRPVHGTDLDGYLLDARRQQVRHHQGNDKGYNILEHNTRLLSVNLSSVGQTAHGRRDTAAAGNEFI